MTKSRGVGRGNYKRKAGQTRNRLTLAEKKAKAFVMSMNKRPKVISKQAGKTGANQKMTGSGLKPEVKSLDLEIIVSPPNGNWTIVSSNLVGRIVQGLEGTQRIGRKITVVGVILRLDANTYDSTTANNGGQPFTIDLILDKQPNGGTPATTTIYQPDTLGVAVRTSLPNVVNQKRFQWLRSNEYQGQQTPNTTVFMDVKTNFIVSYDASAGLVTDVESNNLLICASSADNSGPVFSGRVRLLYIDM